MNAAPSLLLVEDNEGHSYLIQEKFRDAFPECRISLARSIRQASKLLPQKPWDLIIVSAQLPDGRAGDFLEQIAATQPFVAVAVLTDGADDAGQIELEAAGHHGAVEILTKDRQTLESFVSRVRRLMSANQRLCRLLHEKSRSGNEPSFRDPLTRVYSRAYFDDTLRREVSRANRYQHEMSLLIVDVDGFSELTERRGKNFGERCLKRLASVLVEAVREGDLVARYGDNQFVMLLSHCRKSDSLRCARRILKEVRDKTAPEVFTVSIGSIHYRGDSKVIRPRRLIRLAERALSQAKALGGARYAAAS